MTFTKEDVSLLSTDELKRAVSSIQDMISIHEEANYRKDIAENKAALCIIMQVLKERENTI